MLVPPWRWQVRVLAARDPHGDIGLLQARAPDGSLVIASGAFLPGGCTRLQEIPASHFKYGWLSDPQRFANNASTSRLGAQQASAAAMRALQVGAGALKAHRHARLFCHVLFIQASCLSSRGGLHCVERHWRLPSRASPCAGTQTALIRCRASAFQQAHTQAAARPTALNLELSSP